MARILSIDSSVPSGSVALLDHNRILSTAVFTRGIPGSKSLLTSIDQLFADSLGGLAAVDAFAVTTGPGSFTGLRVGVSLVKGLVLATGKPFLPVNTLEALAGLAEPCEHQICPVLDARKKEVYAAFFEYKDDRLSRLSSDMTISPEELAGRINRTTLFIGQGIEVYETLWRQKLGPLFLEGEGIRDETTAVSAGRLATDRLEKEKDHNLDNLQINYIRRSEAEINSGRQTQGGKNHGHRSSVARQTDE